MTDANAHGNTGPSVEDTVRLAEYASLRAEIDRRSNVQWNALALQITTAGTIAGFAITKVSIVAILLLIPFTSYTLGSRYLLHHFQIKLISRYVRDSLSPRLPGLHWEVWKSAEIRHDTGVLHPVRLAFEGVAVIALAAYAALALHDWLTADRPNAYLIAGYASIWLIGVAATYALHRERTALA